MIANALRIPQEIMTASRRRIDSRSNPLVKTLRRLGRPGQREDQILLEGTKLVEEAVAGNINVETVVVSSSYRSPPPTGVPLVELDDALFRTVTTVASPEGILAIAQRPRAEQPTSGLVALAAGVQDPGNLGALARVAEAAGATGLVVVAGSTDPFGPKAVRGSMGSVLRIPVYELDAIETLTGFRKIALVAREGVDYRDVDYRSPCAVVLGGESSGLDSETLARCDVRASIPMRGGVESLNVATAAALVLYHATRRDA